ncbi:type 1 glutamine amidotransferase domain-containing protein [Sphingomicrobium astaxanthinifaciens]|uniref:type 1 glutamine amidotransferase domain-containing protein n=1 Tax=Sphingomicrobium astaxanthinifaciens TaxID=1227949 RepID=UPI001FCA98C9|nr:type 1 glutamine amidotransferase domain-containing protein [Sphingomicrobium astaxanthinifaciens]MCJ7421417.1 type 1 glutamine amidotransferase domain-containing protein [Sphingomicrobium astaxanthinifaciens]
MNILIVLTSHDELGDTGEKTGFWLEELAAPYYVLKDAGHRLTLASPKGGQPPLDPKSDEPDNQTEDTERFKNDPEAQQALATTKLLSEMDPADFDAVFYPGGHGPLWDLAESADSKRIIEGTLRAGKPVALVCHAPAVLKIVETEDGAPIVKGRKVTGFTNEEEEAVGLTDVVPFLLEDTLKEQGAQWSEGGVFAEHVVADGLLITGQNPPSSAPTAQALMKALAAKEEYA